MSENLSVNTSNMEAVVYGGKSRKTRWTEEARKGKPDWETLTPKR